MRAVSSLTDGADGSPENWLLSLLPVAQHIAVQSGFLTAAGLEVLGPALGLALSSGARLSVITGGRADQVDLRGLRMLLELAEQHPGRVQAAIIPGGSASLTAKSYAVRTRTGGIHTWTGSANLTRAGLTRNLQAGLILEADDDHAADFPVAEKVYADILAALADERAEPLTRAVLDQLRAQQSGSPQALADILEAVIDTVEASSVAGSEVQSGGIPTGFADLDRLLGGLRPGMLYLLAGEPAVGKSTLALDLARSAAIRHQHSTVFFSTQSSSHDLTMKIASAEARIPVRNIRQGLMREKDWIGLARTMADLAPAPLALACAGHLTVQTVTERLTELTEEVELVLVDTVNAIRVPHRREVLPREQEIGIVISDLKALAIDLDVPVVVTASLNRGPSYRTDRVPRLDDVRDSGQLADVADVVLLLHRPDMVEKESPRAGEADFIVAKSRLTPTDTITVAFQGHYSRFVDMAT